jgi:hypothetical protein
MDKNWKAQFYNLREDELDSVVWRYLTFPKFIHLISYGALWFCRLEYLIDKFEGRIPEAALTLMREENEKTKECFPHPEYQRQINNWPEDNVASGRSLTAANCWFIGDEESSAMWKEYARGPDGVAIKSSMRKVWESIYLPAEFSFIGKVKYVDFNTYEMSSYEAHQAHHRAFLKDISKFGHEHELRLCTMNIKTTACLDSLGRVFSNEDITGAKMNNFDEAGLQVRIDLRNLFDTLVLAPGSQEWFKNLVTHLSLKGHFKWNIQRSRIK